MASCRVVKVTQWIAAVKDDDQIPFCDIEVCRPWLRAEPRNKSRAVDHKKLFNFAASKTDDESSSVLIIGGNKWNPTSLRAASSSWVEVTRVSAGDYLRRGGGCWYRPATGSGIWINMGNHTKVLPSKNSMTVFPKQLELLNSSSLNGVAARKKQPAFDWNIARSIPAYNEVRKPKKGESKSAKKGFAERGQAYAAYAIGLGSIQNQCSCDCWREIVITTRACIIPESRIIPEPRAYMYTATPEVQPEAKQGSGVGGGEYHL